MVHEDAFYYIILAIGVVVSVGLILFVWRANRPAAADTPDQDTR